MFSIKESVKYGWSKFKENLNLCLSTTLLVIVFGFLAEIGDDVRGFGALVIVLASIVASLILRIGYTKIFLRLNDGEKPKFSDILSEYGLFWKFLGVSILNTLIVIGGLILVIIPGIFWAIRFSFASLILVDTHARPVAALKESYAITKGKFWKLLGFYIVMGLLNLAGFMVLGVGLLVSIPLTMLAVIYVYRKLTEAKASVSPVTPLSPANP